MASLFKYKNSKKWWIRIHRPGTGAGKKECIPTHTEDRCEAEAMLDRMKGDRAYGKPMPRKGAHTIKLVDLCTELLDQYERRGKKSFKQARSRFVCHIVPWFGTVLAVNVDDAMIEQYKEFREGEDAALKSIDNELELLSEVFKRAKKLYKIVGPEIARYRKADKDNPRQGYLEVDEFLRVMEGMPDQDRRDFFWTLAITGWRYGEIQNIRRRHVNLAKDELRLDPGSKNSKTGEARTFLLTDILREIFTRRLSLAGFSDDPVFTYQLSYADGRPRGQRRPIGDMRAVWATACYRAGIPCQTEPWSYTEPKSGKVFSGVRVLRASKTPHDLRRSQAKNNLDWGIQQRISMQILGHKTDDMHRRYGIVSPTNLTDARDTVNSAYNQAVAALQSGRVVVEFGRKSKSDT